MAKKKNFRSKGKLQLSKYFQEIREGDFVAVKKEPTIQSSFPDRLQGRTGIVESKRGNANIVAVKDVKKDKKYIIESVHLKKIKTTITGK